MLPVLLVGLIACGAARARPAAPEVPAWTTPTGRDEARLELVEMLLDSGNPEGALAMVARVRAEGARGPELDLLQGRALRQTGLLDDALEILSRVPARHPSYPSAQSELGLLEMDRDELGAATSYFSAATRADPENAAYWNNLGFCLLSAGRAEEAVDALRRSLALDASSPRTRNNLGFALLAAGRDKEAWRVFRAGTPEADARYNLGVGYELKGDLVAATAAYQDALKARPEHAGARAALDRMLPNVPSTPQESP